MARIAWGRIGSVIALLLSNPAHAEPVTGLPGLEELVEMSNIDSLALSPDGRWLAYRVIERSLRRNETRVQWYAVATDGSAAPRSLGPPTVPLWLPLFDVVLKAAPVWSPDSSALYVRLVVNSAIAIHRLGIDGPDKKITDDPADVERFSLAPDGSHLNYNVRNARVDIARAQAREEREGVHLDKSVYTEGFRLTGNFRVDNRVTTIRGVDVTHNLEAGAGPLQSRSIRLPSAGAMPAPNHQERDSIIPGEAGASDQNLVLGGKVQTVTIRQTKAADPVLEVGGYTIEVHMADGTVRPCRAFFCSGLSSSIRQVGVGRNTGEVVIFYEKDFSARTELYGWNPVSGKSRLIARADGSWDGGEGYDASHCLVSGGQAYCVHAGPAKPPRLLRIDLVTGKSHVLADPNAKLGAHDWGSVRALEWRDDKGRPANGVLVLPPGAKRPVPLVITTYRCRGFLRGGISWLTPEYRLAARGIAALCVNNVNTSQYERDARGQEIPLAQHKAALASYKAIIDKLVHDGLVDGARVGISGHSYSANVVGYAISHSDLFAAAVIGGGLTIDPGSYFQTASAPDSWRKTAYPNMALPLPGVSPGPLWAEISPALNAARIKAPLLMLPPESEYAATLQLYTGIADAGGTVDEYIFPHEGHMANREPAHSYWRALRALDWFSFWLGGTLPQLPDRAAQFAHWQVLRAAREATAVPH